MYSIYIYELQAVLLILSVRGATKWQAGFGIPTAGALALGASAVVRRLASGAWQVEPSHRSGQMCGRHVWSVSVNGGIRG